MKGTGILSRLNSLNGVGQTTLNFFTEVQEMDLERVTSTGHVTTKGRRLHSSKTRVDTSLEGLLQFLGQARVDTNKPLVHSSSRSQTCMESSLQSSLSRMKMMDVLFAIEMTMDQHLEMVMIFTFQIIATQTTLMQISHIHTTTRQEKDTAFSQATQATNISRYKRLKCSGLMFKMKTKFIQRNKHESQ